jgi:hypothetical protein
VPPVRFAPIFSSSARAGTFSEPTSALSDVTPCACAALQHACHQGSGETASAVLTDDSDQSEPARQRRLPDPYQANRMVGAVDGYQVCGAVEVGRERVFTELLRLIHPAIASQYVARRMSSRMRKSTSSMSAAETNR